MTTITEDYISFEIAKLLKEKGFDADIDLWYDKDGNIFDCYKYEISRNWRVKAQQEVYFCPTLQMAMKWLRLRHHFYIHVVIYCDQESSPYWNWFIDNTETGQTVGENTSLMQCDSPEEAYNNGIKYCLENLIK